MSGSGLLVVDKPGGLTSHDVVARVRRVMGTRKVGHAGTLDPMATGVLVIGVNKATRLLGHLALHDKRYLATMRLGSSTVTDDREGEAISVADPAQVASVTDDAIRSAAASLVGEIDQQPSAVSAIKVDGRRAYDRVRAGEDVSLASRRVVVTRLDVVSIVRAEPWIDVDLDVECSTGTYVRALARDMGAALGVGGHLTALRRTRVGPFSEPIILGDLEDRGADALMPMRDVATACFPIWSLDAEQARAVGFGQRIAWTGPDPAGDPVALIDPEGEFLALAVSDEGAARHLAVLG